jgi:ketosteroid isomerase-like protein
VLKNDNGSRIAARFALQRRYRHEEKAMSTSNDEAALTTAIEKLYNAIRDKDAAAFESLVTHDLSYGHSSGRIENKAEFIANVLKPNSVWKTIYGAKQKNYFSGDTAVSRHIMAGEVERDGKPATSNMDVLMVWQKQGGAWRLLVRQGYKA